jgi:peptidoglycan hydrolase CwlO-like protein
MNFGIKKLALLLFVTILLIVSARIVYSQTETPTPTPTPTSTPDTSALQGQIKQYEQKIADLQGQERTFSSQIQLMDNQIKLTEYKIEATQEQITSLTLDIDTAAKKITSLQGTLETSIAVLINRIVATYEVGTIQPLQILLTSSSASDFFTRLNYLRLAQAHDKKLIYDTQQAKVDYVNQKDILQSQKAQVELLKKQLQTYSGQLDQEKQAKQRLLEETQGSEANYQSLLSQAKAQLAGFSGFATSRGGASILTNQTVCDDWGCYYNQRDSQWGNASLNNTQYSIASDGCLVTSMAMVYTHIGHRGVTPLAINSNPSNFASYYPAFLNKIITADGLTTTRIASEIDSELNAGKPVIVGIRYANGDTHFVVIVSGSNGNYSMNDPFTPNGHNISFTSKYSMNNIYEIDKISY